MKGTTRPCTYIPCTPISGVVDSIKPKYPRLIGLKTRGHWSRAPKRHLSLFSNSSCISNQAPTLGSNWNSNGLCPTYLSRALSGFLTATAAEIRGKKFMNFAYEDEAPQKPSSLWNWCKCAGPSCEGPGSKGSPEDCVNLHECLLGAISRNLWRPLRPEGVWTSNRYCEKFKLNFFEKSKIERNLVLCWIQIV